MKKYFILFFCLLSISVHADAAKNIASLKWGLPTQRENGKVLSVSEIAGYEIQYKAASSQTMSKIVLVGGMTTNYDLELATTESYDIYISAYDVKGVSSVALKLTYVPEISPPKMKDFFITQKFIDPQATCTVELFCKTIKF